MSAHPDFALEDPNFMALFLAVAGVCQSGTVPVYRVFSNRAGTNPRYMVDTPTRALMVGTRAGPRTGTALSLSWCARQRSAASRRASCPANLSIRAERPGYDSSLAKYSITWPSPSSSASRGDQPSALRASEISGCRCVGSSAGEGL